MLGDRTDAAAAFRSEEDDVGVLAWGRGGLPAAPPPVAAGRGEEDDDAALLRRGGCLAAPTLRGPDATMAEPAPTLAV